MKKLLPFSVLSLLLWQTALAQPATLPPRAPAMPQHPQPPPSVNPPEKFDLNFAGGKPGDLVAAIEKASGKPLNAIVPPQFADVQIPAMKLTKVTVPDLFEAMKNASIKEVRIPNPGFGPGSYQSFQTYYAFETRGSGEDAVWYFKSVLPPEVPEPEKYCRFYQLEDYLANYKIEDITTAIKTGWAMLGVQPAPDLKFHPETKLLIAVGPSTQLGLVDNVLGSLRRSAPKPPVPSPPPPRLPAPHKKDGTASEP